MSDRLRTSVFPVFPTSQPESAPSFEPLPGITLRNGFTFRKGQHEFLGRLANAFKAGERYHLGVFVPGYGKTITALASFVIAHALGVAEKLVVFVPRGNLRDQYADPEELNRLFRNLGTPPFSFCVADSEKVFLKNLNTQIIITTYQYAAGRGGQKALRQYCESAPCLHVYDEIHHLAGDGTWASKIGQFACACSIGLSGTPMRSDNKTLFGVPFETGPDGDQYYVALHEVTMRDAHEEGEILKHVEAHVIDYRLKLFRADTGQEVEMSLSAMAEIARNSKEVDTYLARRKLRFHEVYLESLLGPAFERFAAKRRRLVETYTSNGRARKGPFRNHQMLLIAMSNRHAAAILEFIRARFPRYAAARIGQDVPAREREALLEQFRNGEIDVMVQVDMIGEGTDIKPISVIVKADLVRAYSKTLQQVFRGMRHYAAWDAGANVCDIYAANDSQVVHVLEWITSEQQIGVKLRKKRQSDHVPAPSERQEHSAWELRHVEQRRMKSHSLELFPSEGDGRGALYLRELHEAPPLPEPADNVIDVGEREKALRKHCADLAAELAFVLGGRQSTVRGIHAHAKRLFGKGQDALSLAELEQKRRWLERCLRAGRLV